MTRVDVLLSYFSVTSLLKHVARKCSCKVVIKRCFLCTMTIYSMGNTVQIIFAASDTIECRVNIYENVAAFLKIYIVNPIFGHAVI